MTRKIACLADCDRVFYGADPDRLGRRMRDHLREAHGVPADPTELATLSIPVAGVRPGDMTPHADTGAADASPDA